jgi:hypothetical protein
MRQYIKNLKLWGTGWSKFDELQFKAGWSGDSWRWRLLYLIDHGTRVLLGGAVVTWSRWFYDNRDKYGWAKFLDRLLNHIDSGHGADSGPELWGSKDTAIAHVLPLVALAGLAWVLWAR